MKILVIGSSGMLGSAIKRNRTDGDEYIFEDHKTLSIDNRESLMVTLEEKAPDVVINTAAFLGVEPCAENPGKAFAVNAKSVKDLAEICNKLNICLVHFSTDGVFDGKKGDFYTENDIPNPVNMYGMTKYVGELFVKNICSRYFIIRVPILFGTRENVGSIFIEKMHKLAASGKKELRISDDVISCPSYSDDIAIGTIELIKTQKEYGLYHLKNEGKASLYDFARVFFEKCGIIDVRIYKARASDFSMHEKDVKPLNTAIKSVKIPHLRPWEEAMGDFVVQFKNKEKKNG